MGLWDELTETANDAVPQAEAGVDAPSLGEDLDDDEKTIPDARILSADQQALGAEAEAMSDLEDEAGLSSDAEDETASS